jgi:hypothetical protein
MKIAVLCSRNARDYNTELCEALDDCALPYQTVARLVQALKSGRVSTVNMNSSGPQKNHDSKRTWFACLLTAAPVCIQPFDINIYKYIPHVFKHTYYIYHVPIFLAQKIVAMINTMTPVYKQSIKCNSLDSIFNYI